MLEIPKTLKIISTIAVLAVLLPAVLPVQAQELTKEEFLDRNRPLPQTLTDLCPVPERHSAADTLPGIRYSHARDLLASWRCVAVLAATLPDRQKAVEREKIRLLEENQAAERLLAAQKALLDEYAVAARIPGVSEPFLPVVLGPEGLAGLDLTGVHSHPRNRRDPYAAVDFPAGTWQAEQYQRYLQPIAGAEAEKIQRESRRQYPRYVASDLVDSRREAERVTLTLAERIRSSHPSVPPLHKLFRAGSLIPGSDWIVITKERFFDERLLAFRFLCRFIGQDIRKFEIWEDSREGQRVEVEGTQRPGSAGSLRYLHTEWRCGGQNPNPGSSGMDWLQALKEERSVACSAESPEISETLEPWLRPRCLQADLRERKWIRDGTLPLSQRHRRFGEENLAQALAFLAQAEDAQAELQTRENLFRAAAEDSFDDPRTQVLLIRFLEYSENLK